MPRLSVALGILLAAAVASGFLFLRLPGEPLPPVQVADGPWPMELAYDFPLDDAEIQCGLCHYAWDFPADVRATRLDPDAANATDGLARYSLAFSSQSGYELPAVLAVPRASGDDVPEPDRVFRAIRVPQGTETTIPYAMPWPARAVFAVVWSQEPYERPGVEIALGAAGSGESVTGGGSGPHKHALLTAPEGATLDGDVALTVRVVNATGEPPQLFVVLRAFPEAYGAASAHGAGVPAALDWTLPPPGARGAPEGFDVFLVAFNAHPPEKWMLPVIHDRGEYRGRVSASEALVPVAPRNWTAEDVAAAWAERESVLLYEESFDGLRVRHINERGEWTRQAVPIESAIPEEAPFPAIPPGTGHVRATLTWEPRVPGGADYPYLFSFTHRPRPDFGYPEPNETAPGRAVVYAPIEPSEWEDAETGWFQGFALMRTDEHGNAVFDGRHRFVLEAFQGPATASSGTPDAR